MPKSPLVVLFTSDPEVADPAGLSAAMSAWQERIASASAVDHVARHCGSSWAWETPPGECDADAVRERKTEAMREYRGRIRHRAP